MALSPIGERRSHQAELTVHWERHSSKAPEEHTQVKTLCVCLFVCLCVCVCVCVYLCIPLTHSPFVHPSFGECVCVFVCVYVCVEEDVPKSPRVEARPFVCACVQ